MNPFSRLNDDDALATPAFKRLVFVRSAVSTDERTVFQHSGTLWRDPETEVEIWLHPSTVQREGMVERAREGITEEQERLDRLRASGTGDEDPIFSEVRARTAPPRRVRGDGQGTDAIDRPSGHPVPPNFMSGDQEFEETRLVHSDEAERGAVASSSTSRTDEDTSSRRAMDASMRVDSSVFQPISGEWKGWRFHFVGDQVGIDNRPARDAAYADVDALVLRPEPVNVVLPLELVRFVAQYGR